MRPTNAPLLILLAAFAAGCTQPPSDAPKVTNVCQKALPAARTQAEKLGYDLAALEPRCEDDNAAWQKYVAARPKLYDDIPDLKAKLTDKPYWAVHFGPKPEGPRPAKGGDLWVFVHKESGEVLTYLRGK
ncbi:MAG: hypothetical protein HY763_08865 [Planctomycetes bacterium]|nr:hypothetical protein [Planctomycetota bacterium]